MLPRVDAIRFIAGLLLTASVSIPSKIVVFTAPSLTRIGQQDEPLRAPDAELWAALGEYESFQIVVRGGDSGLKSVTVALSDLSGPNGYSIAKANLEVYREHYVLVRSSSPDMRGSNRPNSPGWYADALIPAVDRATGQAPDNAKLTAFPFDVPPGRNQPLWVDVLVPRSAVPGTYTGSYLVNSSEGVASGRIVLHVWNFSLPVKPSLESSFGLSQAGTAGAEELLRHRVAPLRVNPAEQRRLIDEFGLGQTNLGFWSGADVSHCSMTSAPSVDRIFRELRRQQPDLLLFNFTADEIDRCPALIPVLKDWARNLHQAWVRNLVSMKPVPELYDDGSGSGRSAVDIWVLLPTMYDAAGAAIGQVLAKGDAIWSSNTLVQDDYSPKWEIDFDPINFRVQPGFLNQSLACTGLLYWRVDRWPADPWNEVNNAGVFGRGNFPGEGMLIYPGWDVGVNGVVASMRLKWLRDGVDDYDYVELLKKHGQGDLAMEIVGGVARDWRTWTRDSGALESARRKLGDALDRIGATAGHPEPHLPPRPATGAKMRDR